MAMGDSTTGRRISGAWLSIAAVAAIGWVGGNVSADRYVNGLERDDICADIGVALGDTVLRGVERARRDSAELADRNCSSRYRLARQGRANSVHIPLAIGVVLSALVATLFSIVWVLKRLARSRRPSR